jgi:glutaredoxin
VQNFQRQRPRHSPPWEVFVREGCPHCAKAEQFLATLARERPELDIVIRDVLKEPAALQRLQDITRQQQVGTARVPAFFCRRGS